MKNKNTNVIEINTSQVILKVKGSNSPSHVGTIPKRTKRYRPKSKASAQQLDIFDIINEQVI